MSKNYVSLHNHDYYSNLSMVECIDSPKAYMERVKELDMKAIAISNHGSVLGWYNRYLSAKKYGVKYIHATELYLTETTESKKRDNWHILLIAKNYEGFKELNRLSSVSTTREDNHYYYNPRISLQELYNTSDNIIVLSACMGGVLWQTYKNNQMGLFDEVFTWFKDNKHRAFLEVQPHRHLEQIKYNKLLKELAEKHDMKLVATGDFHAVSKESDETRAILKKSKKIAFEEEDTFSLYLKSYDEIFAQFMNQSIWREEEVAEFLEQTNVIADMIEEFEIDTTIKYPKLYDDGEKRLQSLITNGIKERGIDTLPLQDKIVYAERLKYELETIKKLDCADYLLLEDDVKTYARENNIKYGIARGSASGSLVTYLTKITDINPIKENLSFGRFLNPERVGVADIDSDFDPQKRHLIQQYLLNHPKLDCAHIIAFGTLQLKGAIRDIGRGLGISLSEVDDIAKNVEENERYYRDRYQELFKHVDRVVGCIVSMGVHPCGILVSDRNLNEEVGTYYVIDKETGNPVRATAIDMKEVEGQQWTKLDILALDSIAVIDRTCELAGINYEDVMPDNIDAYDEAVWESIKESGVGIFQFEGDFAMQIYKDLFSRETIEKIRERNPNFSYTDLFSLANAILRPSGASYRDKVVKGEFTDNGHEAINEFLKETLGVLAYQEQQTAFLVEFCSYTEGQADLVRKGIAKKRPEILDVEIPKIETTLHRSLVDRYNMCEEEAEKVTKSFIQVFMDAVGYSFSRNHSIPYSYTGYATAWLRHYYPLEFLTACLNINIGKEEKTNKLVEYAKSKGIEIKPIKFRYSKAGYMMDKESNSIYQGIHPVKFLNAQVADGLYKLRDNKYDNFVDLLIDIKDGAKSILIPKPRESFDADESIFDFDNLTSLDFKEFLSMDISKEDMKWINTVEKARAFKVLSSPVPTNSRQLRILITLNFFSEFGENGKLLNILDFFESNYKASHKLKTKKERYAKVLQYERELDDSKIPLVSQCVAELEYLGHAETVSEGLPKNIVLITEVNKGKAYANAKAYEFSTGNTISIKVGNKVYLQAPFDKMDVVQIINSEEKPKSRKVNGKWEPHPTERDVWLKELRFIRKSNDDGGFNDD